MYINSLDELWLAVCDDAKNYIAEVGYNAFVKNLDELVSIAITFKKSFSY